MSSFFHYLPDISSLLLSIQSLLNRPLQSPIHYHIQTKLSFSLGIPNLKSLFT